MILEIIRKKKISEQRQIKGLEIRGKAKTQKESARATKGKGRSYSGFGEIQIIKHACL